MSARSFIPFASEAALDTCGALCGRAVVDLVPPGFGCIASDAGFIRRYNEATGVANTDTDGYRETITLASLRAARCYFRSKRGAAGSSPT